MNSIKDKIQKVILVSTVVLFGLFSYTKIVEAVSINNLSFPRLANYFLKTPISNEEAISLSKWDLVILGMQVQDTNPDIFSFLRKNNPDIIILAYVAPTEFPVDRLSGLESGSGPWHKLYANIKNDWWLYEEDGEHLSFWPGNWALNITNEAPLVNGERWNTYFPRFLKEEVMATGNWDGIFFDSVWETASWVNGGDLDLDRDGFKESNHEIDQKWRQGMEKIFFEARKKMGENVIFIGNGGDGYAKYLNGRLFECFPNQFENSWEGQMPKYFSFMNNGHSPQISIINGSTDNTGKWNDFKDMRFALTSALLNNGFFSYDWGTEDHSQLWWYDEFNVVLGLPAAAVRNLSGSNATDLKEGVWRRDFEKGIVLVNSTNKTQNIVLEDAFERFLGSQDPKINSGGLTTSVSLSSQDGLILLRRISVVPNIPFINGSLTKVYDHRGQEVRQAFYSYYENIEGGKLTTIADLDGDGSEEIVEASGNRIYIKNMDGTLRIAFFPYSHYYQIEVNFAVGDVDGDGKSEIVTGTGQGSGAHVRVFSHTGVLENPGFFAYENHVRHGVRVGVGDLNGDDKNEIITGPGYGAGPQVRIFEGKTGRLLSAGFFAYDQRIRIGVNIAVGDVDGDHKAEIITGAGPRGGPHIRIFNEKGKLESPGFFAYNANERSGVGVATADINNDGRKEIFTFQTSYFD